MSPLSREEIASLSVRSDRAAWVHVLGRFAFHAGLVGGSLSCLWHGYWLAAVLVLIPHWAAFSFLGWAGIGHELFHKTVFVTPRMNRMMFKLCAVLTWSNYGYFRASHAKHHRHPLAADDVEGFPHPPIGAAQLLLLLSFDLPAFVRRLKILITNARGIVPEGRATASLFPPGSAARSELIRAARVVLICQIGMMAFFAATGLHWLVLSLNLAPFFFTFFNRTLAICQHYGLRSKVAGDYLDSCRTIELNPGLAFFYANMNYHVEHHMYPAVPFYNLPTLSKLLRSRVALPHLDSGYLGALRTVAARGLFSTGLVPSPPSSGSSAS